MCFKKVKSLNKIEESMTFFHLNIQKFRVLMKLKTKKYIFKEKVFKLKVSLEK
jgi:hypothetical protein